MHKDKVIIKEFDDGGNLLNLIEKIDDIEWINKLSPLSYKVTREKGTEKAFSLSGYEIYERGIYRCICCNNALFSSDTKYNSYTGWPSFWQPIAEENVLFKIDSYLGINRIEVLCSLCDAHLGHVFNDGPEPTGARFCMNTSAFKFISYNKNEEIISNNENLLNANDIEQSLTSRIIKWYINKYKKFSNVDSE